MSNYFERGISSGAILLDASNYDRRTFPLMSNLAEELTRIISEPIELGYDSPAGSAEARQLIAQHETKRESLKILPEQIAIFNGGASGAIDAFFRMVVQDSNEAQPEVIVPTPSYPGITRSALLNGLKPVTVRCTDDQRFQPTVDQINEKITQRTKAIFLTSPGNPVCTDIRTSDLSAILELARTKDLFLCVDAIFEEARKDPINGASLSLCRYDKFVKIKGLSKDRPHTHDLRVGWTISSGELVGHRLRSIAEVSGFSVSLIVNSLLCSELRLRHALGSGTLDMDSFRLQKYQMELLAYFDSVQCGMRAGFEVLKNSGIVESAIVPDAGNLIFVKLFKSSVLAKGVRSDHQLFDYLLKNAGVAVTPGNVFGMDPAEIWFRITVSRSPIEFSSAVEKVLMCLS